MARTKGEPVYSWADNSFKNQTKVSRKEPTYWATFLSESLETKANMLYYYLFEEYPSLNTHTWKRCWLAIDTTLI